MGIASQGAEAVGVFPSSQSQDFIKGIPSITPAAADTLVKDIALALQKQHHNSC